MPNELNFVTRLLRIKLKKIKIVKFQNDKPFNYNYLFPILVSLFTIGNLLKQERISFQKSQPHCLFALRIQHQVSMAAACSHSTKTLWKANKSATLGFSFSLEMSSLSVPQPTPPVIHSIYMLDDSVSLSVVEIPSFTSSL